jgi:hypothetical protein
VEAWYERGMKNVHQGKRRAIFGARAKGLSRLTLVLEKKIALHSTLRHSFCICLTGCMSC